MLIVMNNKTYNNIHTYPSGLMLNKKDKIINSFLIFLPHCVQ